MRNVVIVIFHSSIQKHQKHYRNSVLIN